MKTILITGAASGLGWALSQQAFALGHRVIMTDMNALQLGARADALAKEDPSRVSFHRLDVTDSEAITRLVALLREKEAGLDVLINNVGFGMMGEHVEQDSQKLERMLTLNNILLSKLCMLVGQTMKARGRGKILNIGSLAGFCPMPFFAAYSASKAFVINFSASLHEELKPYGVQVTCFCPSTTKTAFLDTAQSKHTSSSGIREFVSAQIATPEDVARAGYAALKRGKRYALPGLSVTLQSLFIRMMPLGAMANLVHKKSVKADDR